MKKIFLLFMSISFFVQIQAQEKTDKIPLVQFSPKLTSLASKFTISTTASTIPFDATSISKISFKDLKTINLGELNISYKVNDRISYGLSNMSSLSNQNSGYYNAENQLISFCTEDDDDHDDDDHLEGEMDDDLYELDDDDDDLYEDECDEDDDEFGQNIMGTVTYKFSDKIPFFLQAAGGYSFTGRAPAYSAKVGYNQKIFAGLGISAGVRFSDVLYKRPIDAISLSPSSAFKAELGLSWNF